MVIRGMVYHEDSVDSILKHPYFFVLKNIEQEVTPLCLAVTFECQSGGNCGALALQKVLATMEEHTSLDWLDG